jgi:cyclin C
MAANYWESTQRRNWQFTRQQLEELRKNLEDEDPNLVQMYPLPQVRHLSIYFNQRKSRELSRIPPFKAVVLISWDGRDL